MIVKNTRCKSIDNFTIITIFVLKFIW